MSKQKVGLIIVDGLGMSDELKGNAFALARKPTFDKLLNEYPHSLLQASGFAVGLPNGQPGNSEIGHLNIGCGRTIESELVRINNDIENSQFIYNPNFRKALLAARANRSKIHVIGLTSYGGVHSNLTHMQRILNECGSKQIKTVAHIISDGRDCEIGSIAYDIKELQNIDAFFGETIKIGTISGRYYAMDRDNNWDRTRKTVDALLHKGPSFENIETYLAMEYGQEQHTDEFVTPAYDRFAPDTKIEKNDVVIIINFRQDRVRQLAHMFKKSNLYKETSPLWDLNLTLVTMVKYDGIDSDIIIYPPKTYPNTLGQVVADAGLKQLRIAETEKYAHVTFFLDGGKEVKLKNADRIMIPSPKVPTYDLKPEMSAHEITNKLLQVMDQYDLVICNYANCDMVGHTGKLNETIKAVETVDQCLAKVIEKAEEIGMTLFITSDHGNCDAMLDNKEKPITSHSIAPVFFISTDKRLFLNDGALYNIAPTVLKTLGIKSPKEMDKRPLC